MNAAMQCDTRAGLRPAPRDLFLYGRDLLHGRKFLYGWNLLAGLGGVVRNGAMGKMAAAAWLVVAMTVLPIVVAPARGRDRTQTRSMVLTREGIVAAESPLAAQAGATIRARGGNAVDAAVATNAVMGV